MAELPISFRHTCSLRRIQRQCGLWRIGVVPAHHASKRLIRVLCAAHISLDYIVAARNTRFGDRSLRHCEVIHQPTQHHGFLSGLQPNTAQDEPTALSQTCCIASQREYCTESISMFGSPSMLYLRHCKAACTHCTAQYLMDLSAPCSRNIFTSKISPDLIALNSGGAPARPFSLRHAVSINYPTGTRKVAAGCPGAASEARTDGRQKLIFAPWSISIRQAAADPGTEEHCCSGVPRAAAQQRWQVVEDSALCSLGSRPHL